MKEPPNWSFQEAFARFPYFICRYYHDLYWDVCFALSTWLAESQHPLAIKLEKCCTPSFANNFISMTPRTGTLSLDFFLIHTSVMQGIFKIYKLHLLGKPLLAFDGIFGVTSKINSVRSCNNLELKPSLCFAIG